MRNSSEIHRLPLLHDGPPPMSREPGRFVVEKALVE
jgi:hypothetical protein